MEITKNIVTIFCLAIVAIAFLGLLDKREDAISRAADTYEDCIQLEYGMHPVQWYYEHGEYPECK